MKLTSQSRRGKVNRISGFIYYCLLLLFSKASLINGEPFQWRTTAWPRLTKLPSFLPVILVTNIEDAVWFSCKTNDPAATVALYYHQQRNAGSSSQLAVQRAPGRIVQYGQSFFVSSISLSDAGFYTCTAVNRYQQRLPDLHKGLLFVSNVAKNVPPVVYPAGPVMVAPGGSVTITCKTRGIQRADGKSVIAWFQKRGGAQVPVPSTKIISRKSQRADGTFRDVQELRIQRLRGRDLGEYVCVRTVAGVVLSKSVQILLNYRSPKDVANDFIQKKLTENKVVVFCKSYCPYCRRVKGILGDLWNYLNIDVDLLPMQEPLLDALRDMTGKRTVPRVFINKRFIGGSEEIVDLQASGGLRTLIYS